MRMKTIYMIVALLLASVGFISCEMKNEITGKENAVNGDVGYLDLGVNISAKGETVSRDESSVVVNTDVNEFPVSILNTEGAVQKEFASYAELKAAGTIELPVGSYTIEAHSKGEIQPVMSTPYYSGTTTLTIIKDVTAQAEVVCKMLNTRIKLSLSSKFTAALQSWNITVTDGTNILRYSSSDTDAQNPAAQYLQIPSEVKALKVTVTGMKQDGITSLSETRTITKPENSSSEYWEGNDDLTINLDMGDETTDPITGGLKVTVDVTFNQKEDADVTIPVDPDGSGDGSTGDGETGDGDETGMPAISSDFIPGGITYTLSADGQTMTGAPKEAKVNVTAPAGFKSLVVKIKAGNETFAGYLTPLGLDTGKDLLTLDEEDAMDAILMEVLSPLPKSGSKEYSLDIAKGFFEMMNGSGGATDANGHQFTITVTDQNNKTAEATLKVVINSATN